ncbi:MAG: preprotein translocase subunit SecE [Gemmataceae bacterium]
MAVAVKTMPDSTTTSPGQSGLFVPSVFGAVYVFVALAVLVAGVPYIWHVGAEATVTAKLGSFVSTAGLIVVELFTFGVLWVLGLTLLGGRTTPGLKAGVFTIAAGALFTLMIVSGIARSFHNAKGDVNPVTEGIAVCIGALVVLFAARFIGKRGFNETMQGFEHQGWFSAAGYKPNQGKKVRRTTMLGLMVVAGCGIYTLLHHQTLAASTDWRLWIPFAGKQLTILPDLRLTLPLLLAAAAMWISYRLVNVPPFAEFLIATESELNKVAWPTRRSLIQDTIVVLSTVVLMTLFLFFVDIAWGQILSSRFIGVLRLDPSKVASKNVETTELDW